MEQAYIHNYSHFKFWQTMMKLRIELFLVSSSHLSKNQEYTQGNIHS